MDITQILFLLFAAVVLIAGLMVAAARNLIHAALWLVVTLFGVAALYALLDASFLAVVQVVVYIGAIAILFIFAVMLTNKDARDVGAQHNPGWWFSAILAVLVFGGLVAMVSGWGGAAATMQALPASDPVGLLGTALVSPDGFVLPFEVASVLLLAALVGSVYVAFSRR